MSREIKFRAWDKIKSRMCKVLRLDLQGANGEQRNVYLSEGQTRHTGEFELMQYAGITDKNGVEIYEGDIVSTSKGRLQIWYGNSAFGLLRQNGDFEDYICNICDMNGRVFEVIGNIHQTPELLETK